MHGYMEKFTKNSSKFLSKKFIESKISENYKTIKKQLLKLIRDEESDEDREDPPSDFDF